MSWFSIIIALGAIFLGFALENKNKAKKAERNGTPFKQRDTHNADLSDLFNVLREKISEREYSDRVSEYEYSDKASEYNDSGRVADSYESVEYSEPVDRIDYYERIEPPKEHVFSEIENEGIRVTEDDDPDSISNYVFDEIKDAVEERHESMKVDPELMIIYSELMKPKFKEF